MLVFYSFFLALFIVPSMTLVGRLLWVLTEKSLVQPKVDAAALLAAEDLSRIVINDPNFGYISLSNYPPNGKGTFASDGEPLPVYSINTLLGSNRQNLLLAEELNNSTMTTLALADHENLELASQSLNKTLNEAVTPKNKQKLVDYEGQPVDILTDVKKGLERSLNGTFKVKSINITNGWLRSGGRSTIKAGNTKLLIRVKSGVSQEVGELPPFTDIKSGGVIYQFAGVGPNATLCNADNFRPDDRKHISSIVLLDCVIESSDPFAAFLPIPGFETFSLHFVSSAQPYSNPDLGPPGVMTVRFPGGMIPSVRGWADILSPNLFGNGEVKRYESNGGDFPLDDGAALVPAEASSPIQEDATAIFGECLYYWLRNGRGRASVDSIVNMINRPFALDGHYGFFVYEFSNSGEILVRNLEQDPFPVGVVSDGQSISFVDTTISGYGQCFVTARNEVKLAGSVLGGKHAGQPLAGYPLDWCERPEFQGNTELAKLAGKGYLASHLLLLGDTFTKMDGKPLTVQPRKTFYSGGLAEDIEMSIRGLRNHS